MTQLTRRSLSDLATRRFDVVVIGGGVYGACFAYELASRGMTALLIEKNDFGAAASSNSLRIVHGGLRYLQRLNFKRARLSTMARSTLLRIFPGLITPLLCAVPTGPDLKRGRLAFAGGLALNALMTLDRNTGLQPGQRLPAGGLAARDWLSTRCPDLEISGNSGVAFWYDAFMEDPERLVLNYVRAAVSLGASAINHASMSRYLSSGGRLAGVAVTDHLTGANVELPVKLAIDCRSGWLAHDGNLAGEFRRRKRIRYARGVNLIVNRQLCTCAIGFSSGRSRKNRRFFFMVPHDGKTIIGTWYLPLADSADDVSTSQEERAGMLQDVAGAMPGADLCIGDVIAQHVGIIPCMELESSRTTELVPTESAYVERGQDLGEASGIWLVQGEKWTTARETASLVSEAIARSAGITSAYPRTATTVLSPGHDSWPQDMSVAEQSSDDELRRMWRRRGNQTRKIAAIAASVGGQDVKDLVAAEACIAIQQEMAMTLADTIRRLGLGQLGCPARDVIEVVATVAAERLGWSQQEKLLQIDAVRTDPRYLANTVTRDPTRSVSE